MVNANWKLSGELLLLGPRREESFEMHYPHKISKVKRARKLGFRARMRTAKGRQMINRKRRAGRKVQVV